MHSTELSAIFTRVLVISLAGGAACSASGCEVDEVSTKPPVESTSGNCEGYAESQIVWNVPLPPSCVAGVSDGGTCVALTDGGAKLDCRAICTQHQRPRIECAISGTDQVRCEGYVPCPGGRRFEGLNDAHNSPASGVGSYLASLAYLEAASVNAFLILAEELQRHGAPAGLISAARRSAREEKRHAAMLAALCRRHGVLAEAPVVPPERSRSLERMATENATEGCVRETFGALLACHQSTHAADPALRRVMRRVAIDETRHAALAWRVAAWAEGRLSSEAIARVRAARDAALRSLEADLVQEPELALAREVGLPDAVMAQTLIRRLCEELGFADRKRIGAPGRGDPSGNLVEPAWSMVSALPNPSPSFTRIRPHRP